MKYLYIIALTLFSFTIYSCSEASMEDDAREAAELSTLSNQYSMDNEISKAGETYSKVQEIMNKYKKQNKFDEFYELYNNCLKENSYKLDETPSQSE